MQTTSRVVGVFNPRDAIPPMIPDQFRPSLYERLHLFLLHVLVYLLLGLGSLSQPLARCLQLLRFTLHWSKAGARLELG